MLSIEAPRPCLLKICGDFVGFPDFVGAVVKNLPANSGDIRDAKSISRLGRFSVVRNEDPLQYSCLENSTQWNKKGNPLTTGLILVQRTVACLRASQVSLKVKNLSTNAGDTTDMSSIPGLGRCPGGRHRNSLHYSCLGHVESDKTKVT